MDFSIKIDPATWQEYISVPFRGKPLLLNALLNKGSAFSTRERDELGLAGLLPPAVTTLEKQLDRVYRAFSLKETDLDRYIYLTSLHDRNETLFFRLVYEHIDEMMPIVYTPTVGEACQQYSHIFRRTRGMYVGWNHKGRIKDVLKNFHTRSPSVIVVTDGERILGLGDQGAGGMGIPIGKLALYTLCAGVSPYSVLPITLDVGTNNQSLLDDPMYLGLRERRRSGEEYQEFIDEFVAAVKEVFPNVLLQWEDFLKENAIKQLARFRDELCCFNDDIQGTAGIVVAGLLASLRITGQSLSGQRVLFAGAGASAQGISKLIVAAMVDEGLTLEEARRHVWTTDSRGLVLDDRENLPEFKMTFARPAAEVVDWDVADRGRISLAEVVDHVRPTILLGSSGTPGLFDETVLRLMGEHNEHPIIFPLSNPTSKAECTPEQAMAATDGRAIVATGSPFPPVMRGDKTCRVGQSNNAFLFPGVGLGITVSRARRVTDRMFLEASRALAALVTDEDLAEYAVYPALTRIREVSHAVAVATIKAAVEDGVADPEVLLKVEETVRRAMWYPEYLPLRYETE